ncbi:MAG: zinc-ribbon domain-containing protein [Candidatus Eremiobacteraeota bacterium]|nr:zinc-ribbon domain-containing protein [Candidatus Eremiobacteraeota bacterium]
MDTCANCGSPLPEGANFCPKCGAMVSAAAPAQSRKGMPGWLLGLIIAVALVIVGIPFLAIIAAILIPNFLHARSEAELAADEQNLKSIAVAVERYAVDHDGKYPDDLPQLVPAYISKLPAVPGGDGTGAYDYHHPASVQPDAKYEIWDDGSMDPTTMSRLPRGPNGPPCEQQCKYVVYLADVGIIGISGQR